MSRAQLAGVHHEQNLFRSMRDDIDIADARRLLQEMSGSREDIWHAVEPYLVPGDELKAQYAFADLWETHNGDN